MAKNLSLLTNQQSLVFFPHEAVSHKRLYDHVGDARRAHDIALGEALGRLFNRIGAVVGGFFERARLRNELYAMDDRILTDIGLTRGDIENVVAGRHGIEETPVPAVAKPEEAPVAKPVLVEAILRRAA